MKEGGSWARWMVRVPTPLRKVKLKSVYGKEESVNIGLVKMEPTSRTRTLITKAPDSKTPCTEHQY